MITTLNDVHSFKDLDDILNHSRGDVSFWGTRYVSFEGKKETVSLDSLSSFVMNFVKANPEFEETDRIFGKRVVEKTDLLYEQTTNSISRKNCLTRLFFAIIEYWMGNFQNYGYGTRFHWPRNKDFFKYYTKEQYQKVFGEYPGNCPDRCEGGHPDKWLFHIVQPFRQKA